MSILEVCCHHVESEAFMAVMFQVEGFWVVMLSWSVVEGYQRFRGPCCLHLQGEVDLWNVGILSRQNNTLQPRTPRLASKQCWRTSKI